MMRDMKEFTQAVKDDASKLVASTAAQMKDQLNINVSVNRHQLQVILSIIFLKCLFIIVNFGFSVAMIQIIFESLNN